MALYPPPQPPSPPRIYFLFSPGHCARALLLRPSLPRTFDLELELITRAFYCSCCYIKQLYY